MSFSYLKQEFHAEKNRQRKRALTIEIEALERQLDRSMFVKESDELRAEIQRLSCELKSL